MRFLRLAARNTLRHRRRSALTAGAVLGCVMTVVMVRGLGDGVRTLALDDVVETRSGALQVVPAKGAATFGDVAFLRERLLAVPGVRALSPRLRLAGLVSNGRAQTPFIGRGLDATLEAQVCPRLERSLADGRWLHEGDGEVTLVGEALAQAMERAPGGRLTVQTTSLRGRADARELEVVGLTRSALPFENKRVLQVPLATAQALLGAEGQVSEYALAVDDLDALSEVQRAVRQAAGPNLEVRTWAELQPFVADYLRRGESMLWMLAGVLLAVGLTVVANTTATAVFERQTEVGTLLSFGVRRRQVATLFLYEAALLGTAGALAGAALGRLVVFVTGRIGIPVHLPGTQGAALLRPHVSWAFTVTAVLIALVAAVLASVLPARRAATLDPVLALRQA